MSDKPAADQAANQPGRGRDGKFERGNDIGAAHRWGPGQSGNPKGRPPGPCLTARLRKLLDEDDGKLADAVVRAVVKQALKGNAKFASLVWERLEGKVPQRHELTGAEGGEIQISGDDVRRRLMGKLDDGDVDGDSGTAESS